MPTSKQGDGTRIQKLNMMGDNSDSDVVICCVCVHVHSCECSLLSHGVWRFTVRAIWSSSADKRVI